MVKQRFFRRVQAFALAFAALGAPLAPPLLDAGGDERVAQVEATHDPARCHARHDHAACSQLVKSLGKLASAWIVPNRVELAESAIPKRSTIAPWRPIATKHAPRAPPTTTL